MVPQAARAGPMSSSSPSPFTPPLPAAVHQMCVRFFAAGKPKTHSGVKKRFKITASGRVKYAQYVSCGFVRLAMICWERCLSQGKRAVAVACCR